MDRLVDIIGPAPSEIPFEECLTKLSFERIRVREALARFRETPKTKTKSKRPTKKKQRTEIEKALKELNMSPEDLKTLINNT